MARFKPGSYFPCSVLLKLKNPVIEDGYIVVDNTCDEIRRAVEEEVQADFRDFIFAFSLVSTAVVLGLLGIFWRTYAFVSGHLIPVGVAVYLTSLTVSLAYGHFKRKRFVNNVLKECEDG